MEERQMFKAVCSDCGAECEVPFQPTEGKTVRCLDCFRKNRPRRNNNFRSGGGNRRFSDRPREMHKATCASCGKECEVPFKPTGEKPVYCRECFQKNRPQNNDEF